MFGICSYMEMIVIADNQLVGDSFSVDLLVGQLVEQPVDCSNACSKVTCINRIMSLNLVGDQWRPNIVFPSLPKVPIFKACSF